MQEMATTLKSISDNYKEGGINNLEFHTSVTFLKDKRPDLFNSASKVRYIGSKRKKLIEAILQIKN